MILKNKQKMLAIFTAVLISFCCFLSSKPLNADAASVPKMLPVNCYILSEQGYLWGIVFIEVTEGQIITAEMLNNRRICKETDTKRLIGFNIDIGTIYYDGLRVVAIYETIATFTITYKYFDFQNNAIETVQTYRENALVRLPPIAPQRPGYKFLNWDKNFPDNFKIQQDYVINAVYEESSEPVKPPPEPEEGEDPPEDKPPSVDKPTDKPIKDNNVDVNTILFWVVICLVFAAVVIAFLYFRNKKGEKDDKNKKCKIKKIKLKEKK